MGLRRICNFNFRRRLNEKLQKDCEKQNDEKEFDYLVRQKMIHKSLSKMKSCYFKSAIEVLEQIRAYLFKRQ